MTDRVPLSNREARDLLAEEAGVVLLIARDLNRRTPISYDVREHLRLCSSRILIAEKKLDSWEPRVRLVMRSIQQLDKGTLLTEDECEELSKAVGVLAAKSELLKAPTGGRLSAADIADIYFAETAPTKAPNVKPESTE